MRGVCSLTKSVLAVDRGPADVTCVHLGQPPGEVLFSQPCSATVDSVLCVSQEADFMTGVPPGH